MATFREVVADLDEAHGVAMALPALLFALVPAAVVHFFARVRTFNLRKNSSPVHVVKLLKTSSGTDSSVILQ